MGLFKDCGCGCNGKKQEQKLLISIMSALIFFIIANPDTFRLMRRILGSWVSGPTGCPTMKGLILHTLVFLLVSWGLMNIKKEGYMAGPGPETSSMEVEVPDNVVIDDIVTAAGPSPMEEMAPPKMADVASPLPGFEEDQYAPVESGLMLDSMDIGTEVDVPISKDAKSVSCGCSDGSTVSITRA